MSEAVQQVQPQEWLNVPGQRIAWFDDLGSGNEDARFLSNFYEGEPFSVPGWEWPRNVNGRRDDGSTYQVFAAHEPLVFTTGEHAFQAMKFFRDVSLGYCASIVRAPNPSTSKALGRSRDVPLRPDWEEVKLDVMAAILRSKFALDREEGRRLIETGTSLLIEGTFWQDKVWGVDLRRDGVDPGEAKGRNWLGTLLMARRAELIAEKLYGMTSGAGLWNANFSL